MILPALSLDRVLHVDVYEHAVTRNNFQSFVEALLDRMHPWPLPNSVIVMDNMAIHKVNSIWEMVEQHGSCLVYLPPYSPDLNPIEEAFSSIKAWLCANHEYIQNQVNGDSTDPYGVIWEAIYTITPDDAQGWYRHSSYIV